MYCKNCGSPISATAPYCTTCGAINELPTRSISGNTAPISPNNAVNPTSQRQPQQYANQTPQRQPQQYANQT
ncbi:MAG: zinc ribbon domain-containing protein, partial [Clostridia bacterium]|nr:zinc ribbon domain-containing protein [Clostridia bacterium]